MLLLIVQFIVFSFDICSENLIIGIVERSAIISLNDLTKLIILAKISEILFRSFCYKLSYFLDCRSNILSHNDLCLNAILDITKLN